MTPKYSTTDTATVSVRKTLLKVGLIHEIREDEEGDRGKSKKGKGKTPFVVLANDVM
jgi:hypothetical protein